MLFAEGTNGYRANHLGVISDAIWKGWKWSCYRFLPHEQNTPKFTSLASFLRHDLAGRIGALSYARQPLHGSHHNFARGQSRHALRQTGARSVRDTAGSSEGET